MKHAMRWIVVFGWTFIVVGKGGMGPSIPVPMASYKSRTDCERLAAWMKPLVENVSECVETDGANPSVAPTPEKQH